MAQPSDAMGDSLYKNDTGESGRDSKLTPFKDTCRVMQLKGKPQY